MGIVKIRKIKDKDLLPWNLLLAADPSKIMIESYIDNSEVYIASIGGKIIGEYVLTKINEATIELKNIAVAEKHQGKGTAKILISDTIKKAKLAGFKRIEIGTGNSSLSQLALYQKCGFRIIGVKKDFFIKNYDQKIVENGIKCIDMIRLAIELKI